MSHEVYIKQERLSDDEVESDLYLKHSVKVEVDIAPDTVQPMDAAYVVTDVKLEQAIVKQEKLSEDDVTAKFFLESAVKEEVDIGPVILQPPDGAYALKKVKTEPETTMQKGYTRGEGLEALDKDEQPCEDFNCEKSVKQAFKYIQFVKIPVTGKYQTDKNIYPEEHTPCQTVDPPFKCSVWESHFPENKLQLTSAEKMRVYREHQRDKQMIKSRSVQEEPQNNGGNNNSEQSHARTTISIDSSTMNFAMPKTCKTAVKKKKNKKPAKTAAERNRAYRARKKALKNASNEHLIDDIGIVHEDLPQQHMVDNEINVRENNHSLLYEYLTRQSNSDNEQVNINRQSIVVQVDVPQPNSSSKNPINATQKQSIGKNNKRTSKTLYRKIAKTPAQCSREYRARKKALRNAVNLYPTNVVPDDINTATTL